ncbi:MAG: S53 family peptidase [Solirubrobacteraceae bacterium]
MNLKEHPCPKRSTRRIDRPVSAQPSRRTRFGWIAATALACIALGEAAAVAQATVLPLSRSNYSVVPACGAPAPGRAGCLAVRLVGDSAAARMHTRPLAVAAPHAIRAASAAEGAFGLRPQDLRSAYSLPSEAPGVQTIAIVDAYNNPNIESDLAVYDREFGLPSCSAANGCLTIMNSAGQSAPLPAVSGEWSLEIALDVELAHATCQNCRILLVEAESNSDAALELAEDRAIAAGATEISNSWGGPEPVTDSEAFNHPGVAITAAAGDNGYLGWDAYEANESGYASYPASSPHVVAVGGTTLRLGPHAEWAGETVWSNGQGATGGGCSTHFAAPPWQSSLANWSAVGCGAQRAVADVSAVADPYTGAAVYDSTPWGGYTLGWITAGGTSLSSPIVAAAFALAGGVRASSGYAAQTLYEAALRNPASLHDVTSGANGACALPPGPSGLSGCTPEQASASCGGRAICLSGSGYDGPTGVGSPNGLQAFLTTSSASSGTGVSGQRSGQGAGGGPNAAAESSAGSSPPPASASQPSTTPSRGGATLALSHLALTHAAQAALRRHRRGAVSFIFTASASAPVRVTLGVLARTARHSALARAARGATTIESFTVVARRGHNAARLLNSGSLARGLYVLTLVPAQGPARSIRIAVG